MKKNSGSCHPREGGDPGCLDTWIPDNKPYKPSKAWCSANFRDDIQLLLLIRIKGNFKYN